MGVPSETTNARGVSNAWVPYEQHLPQRDAHKEGNHPMS